MILLQILVALILAPLAILLGLVIVPLALTGVVFAAYLWTIVIAGALAVVGWGRPRRWAREYLKEGTA